MHFQARSFNAEFAEIRKEFAEKGVFSSANSLFHSAHSALIVPPFRTGDWRNRYYCSGASAAGASLSAQSFPSTTVTSTKTLLSGRA